MAKRFIDTGLFDDPWFMDLSKDAKIFWVYCITKCDHAGIIELNERLFKFQTGLKSMQTVIKELSNRLIMVNEQYYFIPKFIVFQYPNFPNSKVRSQKSAIDILNKFKIDYTKYLSVSELLDKSYEHEHVYGYGYENEHVKKAFIKNVKEEGEQLNISDKILNNFIEHWTQFDFESQKYGWQVPETFLIRSRLKGWLKNEDKEKEINYDIK